ncbi:MAG: hypothetical protein NVS1B3_04570 [Candidatus Dormibacteraceae bacterium]
MVARASGRPPDDVYVDEPWLSIRWVREHKLVRAEWKGFCNSSQFRDGTLKILTTIRDTQTVVLLSDNRRLEGVVDQDQLWLRDAWVPMAVAAGLRRIAVLVGRQGLGKIASQEIIGRFGATTFVTRMFESVDEALEWVVDDQKATAGRPATSTRLA